MQKSKKSKKTNTRMRRGQKLTAEQIKNSLLKSIPFKRFFVISLILSLITIALVFVSQSHLPPEIPLYYGLPESEEQLASSSSLIIPSLISIAIFIVNSAIIYMNEDKFIQASLVITTFAVSVLSSITTIKIILLINSF